MEYNNYVASTLTGDRILTGDFLSEHLPRRMALLKNFLKNIFCDNSPPRRIDDQEPTR